LDEKHMKAVVYSGSGEIRVEERPAPGFCQIFYEKKADATPRRSNRRNCWSLVSNERKLAQFIAPVKYHSRKVRLFKNEHANF
jgi:DNA-dependent RNA polymerase auxiliary subunit epsilon